MAYDSVIFDFYGTLTTAIRRGGAHAEVARALGCAPAAFARQLDLTYPARIRGQLGDPAEVLRHLARQLGHSPGPDQVARALRLRMRAIRASIRLRPDAVATLRRLRAAGLRTGLVSDCTEEVPALFPDLPIADLLDVTVFSVEVGAAKPEPAIFHIATRRLRAAPARCLYVGDGGGRELSGAEAVGMRAVRLAAPDLREHLVFDPEPNWSGWAVPALGRLPELARSGPPRRIDRPRRTGPRRVAPRRPHPGPAGR
jgi:putative hydrolase of the HAD superfamily